MPFLLLQAILHGRGVTSSAAWLRFLRFSCPPLAEAAVGHRQSCPHFHKPLHWRTLRYWLPGKRRPLPEGHSYEYPCLLTSLTFHVKETFYCAGWRGVAFHLIVCVSTKVALEVLNYVEHYGIVRQPSQPVQPRHSWNCNHTVSGVLTYNLTRHSHHHADAQTPFQDLRAHAEQPSMPGRLHYRLPDAYLTPT